MNFFLDVVQFVFLCSDLRPINSGIVGLDFKSSRIIQISSSVLPISSTSVIINNKGYPVYHPRIDKYKYEDVNTRFHNFQWTDENKKVIICTIL